MQPKKSKCLFLDEKVCISSIPDWDIIVSHLKTIDNTKVNSHNHYTHTHMTLPPSNHILSCIYFYFSKSVQNIVSKIISYKHLFKTLLSLVRYSVGMG